MRTSRSALAIGASLLGCGLASAASAQYMNFTTLQHVSGSLSDGTYSYANSYTGNTNILVYTTYATPTTGGGLMYAVGYSGVPAYDLVAFGLECYYSGARSVAGSGSFTLTFTHSVLFINFGDFAFGPGSTVFSVGGVDVENGDKFLSGTTYTFDWTSKWTGTSINFYAAASFGFVPLPGAAAMAATAMLAGARRRRR